MGVFTGSDLLFLLGAVAVVGVSYFFILARPPPKAAAPSSVAAPGEQRQAARIGRRRERREGRRAEVDALHRAQEEELRQIEEREEREEGKARAEEAEAQRLLAERRKAEEAEYEKWKHHVVVEEEGAGDREHDDEEALLSRFISHIKLRKVVEVEELAATFGLGVKACAQRLHDLDNQGLLTGVLDDRGRFIHITTEEIGSLLRVFERRGRLTKSELIEEFSRVVRLEPDMASLATIRAEEKLADAGLEAELMRLATGPESSA